MADRNPPKDPRGGHIRLYWGIVDSMAWRALGWADQGLYIAMRRKLSATNNGNIEATLGGSGGLRHAGITSPASLAKGLRALTAVGLIAKTRQGQLSQGRRLCNLFRFTDEPVYEMPKLGIEPLKPTNDWRAFETLGSAKAAIEAAHKAAKTGKSRSRKNASSVQPLNRLDTATVVIGGFSSSKPEHGGASPVQPLNTGKEATNGCKPASALRIGEVAR